MLPRVSGTAWAVPVSAACTSRRAAARPAFRRRSRAFKPSFRPGTAGRSAFPGTAVGSGIRVPMLSVLPVLPALSGTVGGSEPIDDSETVEDSETIEDSGARASASAGAAEAPRSSGSARSG
ncbi:hypothetical protein Plo01_49150 [Planobispora longispora]|uniref:Uncharacterized protein n=1 Tax=Planobispora longispora TaxID=28887 RepID=A0A8J3RQS6_9ACTN|nr:hypothetical protein Plo01_49150 [Planobispora longispora]